MENSEEIVEEDMVSEEEANKEIVNGDQYADEEEVNEHGVKEMYDVVVVGTGLIESILACALAKTGKTVLHLDRNDYYGGDYASFSLDKFIEINQSINKSPVFTQESTGNTQVLSFDESPSMLRHIHTNCDFTDVPTVTRNRFEKSKEKNPVCFGYLMEKNENCVGSSSWLHPAFLGYQPHHEITRARAYCLRSQFNIDLSPMLLFGSGASVDCIIHSGTVIFSRLLDPLVIPSRLLTHSLTYTGIVNYMEFQSLDGIMYYQTLGDVWSVPCSKGDVFNTKILDRLEKRSLMKFLQYVIDWGKNVIAGNSFTTSTVFTSSLARSLGTDVKKLNEIELAQGRALFRPQNKQEIDQQQVIYNS